MKCPPSKLLILSCASDVEAEVQKDQDDSPSSSSSSSSSDSDSDPVQFCEEVYLRTFIYFKFCETLNTK